MSVNLWQLAATLIGVLSLAVAGYYIIRSKVATTNAELADKNLKELERLVGIRGNHITELESAIERAEAQIRELQATVAEMRGQMQAIQSIKAQEIALEVARLISHS